jgi:ATP-dependent phosphofructokinase / diphosphate-dependent phosphofructokinase
VLGHVQRGGTPLPGDRVLATELGCAAVNVMMEGKRNRLIAVRGRSLTDIDIIEATGGQRTVPLDHPLLAAARAVGTCFGD